MEAPTTAVRRGAVFTPAPIGAIYGRNFDDMPELSWPWAYPFAPALMAIVGAGLWLVLGTRDWL
jgi:magnesium transporter